VNIVSHAEGKGGGGEKKGGAHGKNERMKSNASKASWVFLQGDGKKTQTGKMDRGKLKRGGDWSIRIYSEREPG